MIPFFLLAVSIYALDIATKILIRAKLPVGGEISVLPFFSIVHVQNTGVAFGLFQDSNKILMVLGVAVVAAILVMGYRLLAQDRLAGLVLAAVAGGALGNLTDRFLRGRVTDFLDFFIGFHHWPAFNVADSTICVGAGLLLLRSFKKA